MRPFWLSGQVIGSGGIIKEGSGTLILAPATGSTTAYNYYSGGFTLSAGTVEISETSDVLTNPSDQWYYPLGIGTVTLQSGTLASANSNYCPIENDVVVSGSVTLGASGTGSLEFENATFSLDGGSPIITIANTTYIADVIESGTLIKAGAGALALYAANTYTGGTTIQNGILYTEATDTLPSGHPVTVSSSSGDVAVLELAGYDQSVSGLTIYARASSSSAPNIDLDGATLTLTGDIDFLDNSVSPGNGYPGTISGASGSELDLGGSIRTITVDGNNNTTDLQIDVPIIDGGLTITGNDSVYNGNFATVLLDGSNTYTLGTTVNSAILQIFSDSNIGNTSGSLTLNGAELQTYGNISSSRSVVLGSSGGIIDTEGYSVSYGTISGAGGLAIDGGGTVTIASAPTYSGNTVVTNGTLEYDITSGSVSVTNGATVTIDSGGAIIAGGNVDPFSDTSSDRVDIVNNSAISGGVGGFSVTAGSKTIGTLTGSGDSIVASGASLSVKSISQNSLEVAGLLTVRSNGTASGTSVVKSLTIDSGATMDLTNNALIVNYSGSSTPFSTIGGYIASAYDSGNWDRAGLTSSTAEITLATALGYAESSVALGISGSSTASWAGQTVNATSILVMFTWYGDCNLDGVVNSADLACMGDGNPGWEGGDLNYDGVVNSDDYALFSLGDAFQSRNLEPMFAMPGILSPAEYLAEKESEYAGEISGANRGTNR